MVQQPLEPSQDPTVPSCHSEADPPDVLAAKVATLLLLHVKEHITETVRKLNELLLKEHAAMKPLLSVDDLAKTLKVSPRTVEKIIACGEIKPLWIKGQRRFHPDAVDAYLRSSEKKSRQRKTRREVAR